MYSRLKIIIKGISLHLKNIISRIGSTERFVRILIFSILIGMGWYMTFSFIECVNIFNFISVSAMWILLLYIYILISLED